MVFTCLGYNFFEYKDKKTGESRKACVFYGARHPFERESTVEGLVTDDIFITEFNLGLIPSGKFELKKDYSFEYTYDGKYTQLAKIEKVN